MIVYAERAVEVDTRTALGNLIASIGKDEPESVLIRYGQLESAIADALQPDEDDWNETLEELRFASILLAMAAGYHASEFGYDFARLLKCDLPDRVKLRPPEGFAYYSLYPEQYRAAAGKFVSEHDPDRCCVIGIRSIGTTLSSVVATAILSEKCDVFSYTVRPRGHPFDRVIRLSEDAKHVLLRLNADYFLVVDEGPGISGSSFSSVCCALEEMGIARDRVILFPGWDAPADNLQSAQAQRCWRDHRKYAVGFEEVVLAKLHSDALVDISAGAWRKYLYDSEDQYPAVHPQHERRKYVAQLGSTQLFYKFAGLAEFGHKHLERATALFQADFGPEPSDLKFGFLVRSFEAGRPLAPEDLSDDLVDRLAEYIAFVSQAFPAAPEEAGGDLAHMTRVNVEEALGTAWVERIDFSAFRNALQEGRLVQVDGRMLPQEWLLTKRGWMKTDALDHHDDHFYPGCQDIAWDLAGATVEWGMPADARDRLLREFTKRTGNDSRERLRYYEVAYLAYRLGYASMAVTTLAHDAKEQARFEKLRDTYTSALRQRIESLPA